MLNKGNQGILSIIPALNSLEVSEETIKMWQNLDNDNERTKNVDLKW